jgi:peptidoglycan/LPS O-acetylase OafA/YrhL
LSNTGLNLSLEDTAALKGAGILAIALHNYFHELLPIENEFVFGPRGVTDFLHWARDPRYLVQASAAFLGHFGVQLFIFLSAYGLALKARRNSPSWAGFVKGRVVKLYPMFLLSVAGWVLLETIYRGPAGMLHLVRLYGEGTLWTALLVSDFIPGRGLPPVGPWWFLPFIMQFYCVWPGLDRIDKRFGAAGLALITCGCLGATWLGNDALRARYSINLLMTPIGHMPEIFLGVAAARYGFCPGFGLAAAAAVVFTLGCFFSTWWPLSFASALIVMLAAYRACRGLLQPNALLRYLGGLSMAIFFINGYVKRPFLRPFLQGPLRWDQWYFALPLGLTCVAASVMGAALLTRVERWISFRWRGSSGETVL